MKEDRVLDQEAALARVMRTDVETNTVRKVVGIDDGRSEREEFGLQHLWDDPSVTHCDASDQRADLRQVRVRNHVMDARRVRQAFVVTLEYGVGDSARL